MCPSESGLHQVQVSLSLAKALIRFIFILVFLMVTREQRQSWTKSLLLITLEMDQIHTMPLRPALAHAQSIVYRSPEY
jgi:hypothetical protein